MDEKLKKPVVHLYNGILCNRKKKKFLPFVTAWMELETIMLSEISQSVKDKYHMTSLVRRINEQNKLMSKIEPEAWKHGTD